MTIELFMLTVLLLLSLVGHVVWLALWARRARAVSSATEVPVPLEMHLVLNVLSRCAVAAQYDEGLQEGIGCLSTYLTASSRLSVGKTTRFPSAAPSVRAFWQLQNWIHGVDASLEWRATAEPRPLAQLATMSAGVQQLLRELAGKPVERVVVELDAVPGGSGAAVVVRLTCHLTRALNGREYWSGDWSMDSARVASRQKLIRL